MKYKIIEIAANTEAVAIAVQEAIAEGWVPQGGLTSTTVNAAEPQFEFIAYTQAMIKEEK